MASSIKQDYSLTEASAADVSVSNGATQEPHMNPSLDCKPKTKPSQEPHVNPSLDCRPQTKPSQEPHENSSLDCRPKTRPSQEPHINTPSLGCRQKTKPSQELHVNPSSDCRSKTKPSKEPHVNPSLDCRSKTKPSKEPHVNPSLDCRPKIKPSQEPHIVNPPSIDCRPKVFPGTSNSSSTVSGFESDEKKTIGGVLSFKCDENFECEILEGDDESSNARWNHCKKYPGHKNFIPVKEFSLDHLPEAYRKQVFLKGIKSMAKLTVRLRTNYVSKNRPNDDIYSKFRGGRANRKGTGFVCERLSTVEKKGLEIPEFFWNNPEEDHGTLSQSSIYHAQDIQRSEAYKSVGLMKQFFDCSSTSFKLLKSVLLSHEFIDGFEAISKSDKTCQDAVLKSMIGPTYGMFFPEAFSTPGFSYDIKSIRKLADEQGSDYSFDELCKGIDTKAVEGELKLGLLGTNIIVEKHKSAKTDKEICEKISGLLLSDFTCEGHDVNKLNADFDYITKVLTKMSATLDDVLKNTDFSEVLAPCYLHPNGDQYDDSKHHSHCLREILKKIDDIERKLEGKDDYNDNDDDADNDDNKANDNRETSCQKVIVKKPCVCPECSESKKPKTKGYLINVMTARHVVFDKEEAVKTVVDFFCDDEYESGMVQLPVVDIDVFSGVGDIVTLMCATHDTELVLKLKISKRLVKMKERIKQMKAESNTPLVVVCSHPHGNFKHVSVGEWTKRMINHRMTHPPSYWTSYLYDTATCPGSSGAPALILGYKDKTLLLDTTLHPHHGHEYEDLNKSTRFMDHKADVKKISPKAKQRVLKHRREIRKEFLEDLKKGRVEELSKLLKKVPEKIMKVRKVPPRWKDNFIERLHSAVEKFHIDVISSLDYELLQIQHALKKATTNPSPSARPSPGPSDKSQHSIPLD